MRRARNDQVRVAFQLNHLNAEAVSGLSSTSKQVLKRRRAHVPIQYLMSEKCSVNRGEPPNKGPS